VPEELRNTVLLAEIRPYSKTVLHMFIKIYLMLHLVSNMWNLGEICELMEVTQKYLR